MNRELVPFIRAEELTRTGPQRWKGIRKGVIKVDKLAFPPEIKPDPDLSCYFKDSETTAILLRRGREIIGFTYAIPVGREDPNRTAENDTTAYIANMAILPEYQNTGKARPLIVGLANALIQRGYSFVEAEVFEKWGFARAIARTYKDRIVEQRTLNSKRNPGKNLVFFRIRL